MLNKLSEKLRSYAKGRLILLFLAAEIFFNIVVLPNQLAKIQAVSGGTSPIDLQFFYTPEKVYSMVASYGDTGRAAYRLFELIGDIVYPIIYTSLLALLITWLFQRGFAPNSKMQKCNVVPLGAWLFDLLENLGIVAMLSIYPSTPAMLAWLSAAFTLTKWLFVGVNFALVLIGFAMALRNGFKKQS